MYLKSWWTKGEFEIEIIFDISIKTKFKICSSFIMKSIFFLLNWICLDYKIDIICVITLTFLTSWYVPNGEAKCLEFTLLVPNKVFFGGILWEKHFQPNYYLFFNYKDLTHHKFNYIYIASNFDTLYLLKCFILILEIVKRVKAW
jgi:hypothetical protein